MNRAADGSSIKLADPAGMVTEWNLTYDSLSDEEATAVQTFFDAAEGSLNAFTFLDPAGNLLAWSGEFDNAVWQKDPLLALTDGVSDPRGTTLAWRIANSGEAGQGIYQTIAAPGDYTYCLTAYFRAEAPATVRLWAGTDSHTESVTAKWGRVVMSMRPAADVTSLRVGLEVMPRGLVEVYGIQVEAQPGPSAYKPSSRGGVYENAHLRDDLLEITKTGLNRHSCTVNIIHANHL